MYAKTKKQEGEIIMNEKKKYDYTYFFEETETRAKIHNK